MKLRKRSEKRTIKTINFPLFSRSSIHTHSRVHPRDIFIYGIFRAVGSNKVLHVFRCCHRCNLCKNSLELKFTLNRFSPLHPVHNYSLQTLIFSWFSSMLLRVFIVVRSCAVSSPSNGVDESIRMKTCPNRVTCNWIVVRRTAPHRSKRKNRWLELWSAIRNSTIMRWSWRTSTKLMTIRMLCAALILLLNKVWKRLKKRWWKSFFLSIFLWFFFHFAENVLLILERFHFITHKWSYCLCFFLCFYFYFCFHFRWMLRFARNQRRWQNNHLQNVDTRYNCDSRPDLH